MARHRDELLEAPGLTATPLPAPVAVRRRTIRGRLARIIALPLVAVVVLLTIVTVNYTSAYQTAQRTTQGIRLLVESENLVHDLQEERGVVSGVLAGDVSFKTELNSARTDVDNEHTRLKLLAVGPNASSVATALRGLDGLDAIRARVDAKKINRTDAFAYYTGLIATLNGIDVGVQGSTDETLRRGVNALQALDDLEEYTAQERAFLNGVFAAGGFKTGEYRTFAGIDAGRQEAFVRYREYANPTQLALVTAAMDSGAAREATFFEQRAFDEPSRPFVVSPQSWWSANTTLLDNMQTAQQAVGADVTQRATDLKSTATIRLGTLAALAVLAVIGAIALLATASRSITRPLALLAAEAYAIANVRLPEAIRQTQTLAADATPEPPQRVSVPRRSSAEIAAVANALDGAQETAYELATEQARLLRSTSESLANLGRRNQNLLRRQLGFITELEREETDPGGLANLFELDHLATRMRRNAESLLVLVGESRPRTWSEPVPVADVVRAAISEVEDYRRVTIRRLDDGYVGGAFVAGVAHVIAELIENGLSFSPPDVEVEIQGRLVHGRYLIGITDQGVGMEKPEMERSNARLRGEESFLTAPTRFLGHYVVGQLAKQLGINVELSPSPVTGVTARVTLSTPVLTTLPAVQRMSESRLLAISAPPVMEPAIEEPIPVGVAATVNWFDRSAHEQASQARPPSGRAAVPTLSGAGIPAAGVPAADLPIAGQSTTGLPYTSSKGTFAIDVAHGRGERTRNGLLKRVPGPRRPLTTDPAAPAQPEPTPNSSPQVRDVLNALRAGIARGAQDYAAMNETQSPYLGEAETERSTHVN